MFYVKVEIPNGVTINAEIADNVFTVCPSCGVEHKVELDDILRSEDADLYSTKIYCGECSRRRVEQRHAEEE